MRTTFLFALLVVALQACHKNDLDLSTLNTNPFDRDNPAGNALFTLGPIATVSTFQNVTFQQNAVVTVHAGRFQYPVAYEVWMVEMSPQPDTMVYYSSIQADNAITCKNYQVQLGTEYCYRIELRVNDELAAREERCAVAEL